MTRWDPDRGVAERGIAASAASDTHVIPYNDTDRAVEIVRRVGQRSAALLIEPFQGAAGSIPSEPSFLPALREVTEEVGCLLIFDEVLSFRLGYRGMQEVVGVRPDLTALGKVIGGGTAIGAFGGRLDLMEAVDPRRDDALNHSGTFNANPLSMAAGLVGLRALTRDKIDEINRLGSELKNWINDQCRRRGLPLVASGYGSILQVHAGTEPPRSIREATTRPKLPVHVLFHLLLAEGIFVTPRASIAVSTGFGDTEIETVRAGFATALDELARVSPGVLGSV